MEWLDADAGLVLSLRISQLQELNDLVLASTPEARGSISLATLGAAAVLGWNPFQDSGWKDKGFATDSNLALQFEAISSAEARAADRGQGTALWRTRLVLPTRDAARAKQALSNIGFRERVNLEDKSDQEFAALLQLSAEQARRSKAKLRRAGVFLVARPTIVPGLLLIAQHQDLLVIDLVRPYGPPAASGAWTPGPGTLANAAGRPARGFVTRSKLSDSLKKAKIGLAITPERIAEALLATELDGLPRGASARRDPNCAPFVRLAADGHFDALSVQAEVSAKAVAVDLRYHLRSKSKLLAMLTTNKAPLLAANGQALHVLLRADQLGQLRHAQRSPVSQNWDALWVQAERCHPATSSFAWAIDWPHIAGLFLHEVAALHPQAEALIDSLGSLALASHGEGQDQQLIAEAWIRSPGVNIATRWLRTLFGHEKRRKNAVSWSQGPMRPYALTHGAGSVVGSNLVAQGQAAPKLPKLQSAARGTEGSALLTLRANPSLLNAGLVQHPLAGLLTAWQRLSADLIIDKDQLRFTIDLQRD